MTNNIKLPELGEMTLHMWQDCLVHYNKELTKRAHRIEKLEDELLHCFHRINALQTALRRLIDYGMVSPQDLERAQKALEGKND